MDRIESLEERIAHLIRMVEDLSDVVARQTGEIDRLNRLTQLLAEREADREAAGDSPAANVRPPLQAFGEHARCVRIAAGLVVELREVGARRREVGVDLHRGQVTRLGQLELAGVLVHHGQVEPGPSSSSGVQACPWNWDDQNPRTL